MNQELAPQTLSAELIDPILRAFRLLGLIGFLGGLAALSALWAFGPTPASIEQWHIKIAEIKAIFFACSFLGIVILIIVGSISWWRHRRVLNRQRWFRLMIGMLLMAIPASHLWARTTAETLYEVVEAGRMDEAAVLWRQLGTAYTVSLAVMLLIVCIATVKPRLGQGPVRDGSY